MLSHEIAGNALANEIEVQINSIVQDSDESSHSAHSPQVEQLYGLRTRSMQLLIKQGYVDQLDEAIEGNWEYTNDRFLRNVSSIEGLTGNDELRHFLGLFGLSPEPSEMPDIDRIANEMPHPWGNLLGQLFCLDTLPRKSFIQHESNRTRNEQDYSIVRELLFKRRASLRSV